MHTACIFDVRIRKIYVDKLFSSRAQERRVCERVTDENRMKTKIARSKPTEQSAMEETTVKMEFGLVQPWPELSI